ncbi:hypothetical protein [Piscinibacter sp.]|jgi:hypothetical protein|uniref:hypothetical protein n=1 Tax=Piscinibacter sp. TaxID=1903157 RepID=UPI003559EE17
MSLVRKTLAKYGAKIPAARSTGAKQAPQRKQGTSVDPSTIAEREAKKSGDKKR